MKLLTDLLKRMEIRSVQKCRRNAKLWMQMHNFSCASDVKSVGCNNLPYFVQRYMVSIASIDELIGFLSLFNAKYIFNGYHDHEEWTVGSYGTPMGATALKSITSYSYKRQYTIFSKLFDTSVSKELLTKNDEYADEISSNWKKFTCTPIEYDNGKLVMKLAKTLCSYRRWNIYGIQLRPDDTTIKVLVDLYIDKYSSTLPFGKIVDNVSYLYTWTGISSDALIYVINYMGLNLNSMVDINPSKSSSYPPKVMSISDYILRHLKDKVLHDKILELNK